MATEKAEHKGILPNLASSLADHRDNGCGYNESTSPHPPFLEQVRTGRSAV